MQGNGSYPYQLDLTNGGASVTAVAAFGLTKAPVNVGWCANLEVAPLLLLFGQTDAQGAWRLQLPLQALAGTPAFDLHAQFAFSDSGLPAGIVYADSRAMLEDRVASLRQANIYERQSYRHLLGVPLVESAGDQAAVARTPFLVARIMHTGETTLFASGEYRDRFVRDGDRLLLAQRVAVCDSTVTDTLLALPL